MGGGDDGGLAPRPKPTLWTGAGFNDGGSLASRIGDKVGKKKNRDDGEGTNIVTI